MSDKPKVTNTIPLQIGDVCFVPEHDVVVFIKDVITDDLFVTTRSKNPKKDRTMSRKELKFICRATPEGIAFI